MSISPELSIEFLEKLAATSIDWDLDNIFSIVDVFKISQSKSLKAM